MRWFSGHDSSKSVAALCGLCYFLRVREALVALYWVLRVLYRRPRVERRLCQGSPLNSHAPRHPNPNALRRV